MRKNKQTAVSYRQFHFKRTNLLQSSYINFANVIKRTSYQRVILICPLYRCIQLVLRHQGTILLCFIECIAFAFGVSEYEIANTNIHFPLGEFHFCSRFSYLKSTLYYYIKEKKQKKNSRVHCRLAYSTYRISLGRMSGTHYSIMIIMVPFFKCSIHWPSNKYFDYLNLMRLMTSFKIDFRWQILSVFCVVQKITKMSKQVLKANFHIISIFSFINWQSVR